jgi:hypothetical protein
MWCIIDLIFEIGLDHSFSFFEKQLLVLTGLSRQVFRLVNNLDRYERGLTLHFLIFVILN